jgi:CspA family cold shock protein
MYDVKGGVLAMTKGTVKFFHDKKGWGFIERDTQPDVFVYYADIIGDGHKTLMKGESVEFEVIEGPKGDKAVNVVKAMAAF